jgi:glycosyltransferase involved in cell wall biosynthesis
MASPTRTAMPSITSLSVVVPVYRSEQTLLELVRRLTLTLNGLVPSYEIILVNDRSPDALRANE